jgi:Zn-dependent peptidase ImmA (M78 family)/DNA-binding XRE family transcriptional regulator
MFNAVRLRVARQRLGLTLTKLAADSGVSLRSLTDYEQGKREPGDEIAERLATSLKVPVEFFDAADVETIAVEAASFRKLSKTSATRRDAVLANAALSLEFFAVLDKRFSLPVADIPSFDKQRPEEAAELVRKRWVLGDRPISNMVHLLESKGVRVAALQHEYSDIDAFCFFRDGTPYVFENTSKSGERQRFDLAHELGHLVLHPDDDMDPSRAKSREAEANVFASSFLMPRSAVLTQGMGGASIERILSARAHWRVSAMAMTHRLHELGLLSDSQYRTTCIALQERGFRKAEPGGIVPETSQLLREVMFGSHARVTLRAAAEDLHLHPEDVREFVRNLVPISA